MACSSNFDWAWLVRQFNRRSCAIELETDATRLDVSRAMLAVILRHGRTTESEESCHVPSLELSQLHDSSWQGHPA